MANSKPISRKLSKVRVTEPTYGAVNLGDTIPNPDRSYLNTSIDVVRSLENTKALRVLARINGMVSTTVQNYVSLACNNYRVSGYDANTHEFSREGTHVARTLLERLDTLTDYTKGYANKNSVNSIIETLMLEVTLTSGAGAELVLNKNHLPERIVTFALDDVTWVSDGKGGHYPAQPSTSKKAENGLISLNHPTIFTASSYIEAGRIHLRPMLESSLNILYIYLDFIEDMSRALSRSGHNRLIAKIKSEDALQQAPEEVRNDVDKSLEYLNKLKKMVEDTLNNLEPEDALVTFDNVDIDNLKTEGEKSDYKDILESLNGMVATALKTMPSVIGMRVGKGSQSMSNTETLVHLKSVQAARKPVETIMSRVLTLASRLHGSNTYVKFKFEPIDLRPDNEIAASKSIIHSNILDDLSLGFISDDEAAHLLGRGFRDPSLPKLSGTMFRHQRIEVDATKVSPNNGAQEKALTGDQSSTPGVGKGN